MKKSSRGLATWLDAYIRDNGPFAFHVTRSVAVARKVAREGLMPWDAPGRVSRYADRPVLLPRPGHVYAYTRPPGVCFNAETAKRVVTIDLRRIESRRVVADEDMFLRQPGSQSGDEAEARRRRCNVALPPPDTVAGVWANRVLNDPCMAAESARGGSIAIRGCVAPEALQTGCPSRVVAAAWAKMLA